MTDGSATSEGRALLAQGDAVSSQNPFVALLAFIEFIAAIPVILTTAYQTGLYLHLQHGWSDLHSTAIMVAAAAFWPWPCRWVHFSGVTLQRSGRVWHVPFRLAAFVAAFGLSAYLGTFWSWSGIYLLEIGLTASERLYWSVGAGLFFGLAVYTALTQSRW